MGGENSPTALLVDLIAVYFYDKIRHNKDIVIGDRRMPL